MGRWVNVFFSSTGSSRLVILNREPVRMYIVEQEPEIFTYSEISTGYIYVFHLLYFLISYIYYIFQTVYN